MPSFFGDLSEWLSKGLLQRRSTPGKCVLWGYTDMVTYYAYILKSLHDNKYYYGSCENIERRLSEHNAGKVKATKFRRPFELHYFEKFLTRSEAYKREFFFKSIAGYKWLKEQRIK